LETHDGFSVEQWKELSSLVVERASQNRDWLIGCQLSAGMLAHQRLQRNRAAKKFSDPEKWLWTAKLLEQSSDEKVARMTAAAFPNDARVIDLCCGAGADSVALARRGPVTAIDRCEVACALTRANLAMHFPMNFLGSLSDSPSVALGSKLDRSEYEVICSNAESIEIQTEDWIHVDPDRRSNSGRTTLATFFHPGLDFLLDLMDRSTGGSIKLAPATKCEYENAGADSNSTIKVDQAKIGRQFIAWGGSVRQQRWWWKVETYPAGTTTVSILDRNDEWLHWTVTNEDVSQCDQWSNIVDEVDEIQGYIGDTDGCVRTAGLQGLLASNINALIIGNPFGYIVKRDKPETSSPLVHWFEIQATMPLDRKRLRTYLRERNVGVLEIKVRNIEVDPEMLRKEMKLKGSESATVLITRCGSKTIAIVGRRL